METQTIETKELKRIPTNVTGADSDEDIKITQKAINGIIKEMKDNEVPEGFFLRIATQSRGCAGMSYLLGFDNEIAENDRTFEIDNIKLVIDAKSLFYMMGIEIDYVDALKGSGFVFNNPNSFGTCGCLG